MWEEVKLPAYICERMVAFSIPMDDEILIVSYEGVHLLKLDRMALQTTHEHAEGEGLQGDLDGLLTFEGRNYQMLGAFGGQPILRDGEGCKLVLDLPGELLIVTDDRGSVLQEIRFSDLSGDWGYATYSPNGRWLVIGVPYDLYVYQRASEGHALTFAARE